MNSGLGRTSIGFRSEERGGRQGEGARASGTSQAGQGPGGPEGPRGRRGGGGQARGSACAIEVERLKRRPPT